MNPLVCLSLTAFARVMPVRTVRSMARGFAPRKKFKDQTLHRMFVDNLLNVQPTTDRQHTKLLLLDVRLGAAAVRESRFLQWLGPRAGLSNGYRLLRLYNLDPLGFLQLSDAWLSKRGRLARRTTSTR